MSECNLVVPSRNDASLASTAFYLREEKDDQRAQLEDKDLEVIGSPLIKYGDTTVIVQHMETGLWLSYRVSRRTYFTTFITGSTQSSVSLLSWVGTYIHTELEGLDASLLLCIACAI